MHVNKAVEMCILSWNQQETHVWCSLSKHWQYLWFLDSSIAPNLFTHPVKSLPVQNRFYRTKRQTIH